jgi:hypothetical protein
MGTQGADACLKIAGRQIAISLVTVKDAEEPRLRFDRTAIGFVHRLEEALSASVPDLQTVVVTVTAPIRQNRKTSARLTEEIRKLLASRRAQFAATLHRNLLLVRVLKGGAATTPKLLGFVHNPTPGAKILVDLSRSLLGSIDSGSTSATRRNDRWLVIVSKGAFAPLGAVRHVCSALRVSSNFKKILLAYPDGRIESMEG